MRKVLIVDDIDINREMLKNILQDEYEILEAENGKEAWEIIQEQEDNVAAILLDLLMPVMDGYGLIEILHKYNLMENIPVIVISVENDTDTENRCLELGVADFIGKPFRSAIVKKRVDNLVRYYVHKNSLEDKVEYQTNTLRKQYNILIDQSRRLRQVNEEIIDILGTVVEYRSLESGEHIQRVKGYTRILGKYLMEKYPEYNLTEGELEIIVSASALHDVGKIVIPDNILLKPGRLTPEEFDCMKSHTCRGCEILEDIKNVWDDRYGKVSYEICKSHHERFDGRGYPDGLKGDEIPLAAQLVSIADVYDALTNERCYKAAFPLDKAFEMIINGECGVFSPKLIEIFKLAREEFEELASLNKGAV